jgi:hypothetical protein
MRVGMNRRTRAARKKPDSLVFSGAFWRPLSLASSKSTPFTRNCKNYVHVYTVIKTLEHARMQSPNMLRPSSVPIDHFLVASK